METGKPMVRTSICGAALRQEPHGDGDQEERAQDGKGDRERALEQAAQAH